MDYSFEINNPNGKCIVSLGRPLPTDEEGLRRVKRSELLVRDALERLLSEPPEVSAARMKRLREEAEQITFIDMLDKSVKKTKAETSDREYLEMIYDLASEYSPWVLAKYVGLPKDFLEALAESPTDKPKARSDKIVSEIDEVSYDILVRSIDLEESKPTAFSSLVQAIFRGHLQYQGWLRQAERAFTALLGELKAQVIVTTSPTLMAPALRELEKIKLDLREAIIVFSPMLLPSKETAWRHMRSTISSDDAYRLLIKAAIWSLSSSLTEDLIKICKRFSDSEREDEYYSYGRGDFSRKLDTRIAKETVLTRTVKRDDDRLIYAMKRGGYRTPEIRSYLLSLTGKQVTNDNIRQRYKRTKDKVQKKWSDEVSQSSD